MHSDRPCDVLASLKLFCVFVELSNTYQHKSADVGICKAFCNFMLHDIPPLPC